MPFVAYCILVNISTATILLVHRFSTYSFRCRVVSPVDQSQPLTKRRCACRSTRGTTARSPQPFGWTNAGEGQSEVPDSTPSTPSSLNPPPVANPLIYLDWGVMNSPPFTAPPNHQSKSTVLPMAGTSCCTVDPRLYRSTTLAPEKS